jgi:hypothetical protein
MEFLWKSSESRGADGDLFSGAFVMGSYCNPTEFTFSSISKDADHNSYGGDRPFEDDPNLEGDNAMAFVDDFLYYVERYANWTRGDQVMFLMGCDYQWEHSNECQSGMCNARGHRLPSVKPYKPRVRRA